MSVHVGIGYDSHRLTEERPFTIGGVTIEHDKGLDGHSDADVLTHAVIDALLGAAGLGDIGEHFPDTDESYRDADSLELLKQVVAKVRAEGFELVNVDTTVVAERPKLGKAKPEIRQSLANVLGIQTGSVNVKATTGEGIGFVGRGEGVAALATVSLSKG